MDQTTSLGGENRRPAGAGAGEAADATRGSLVKLGAEVLGRLLGLATTLLVARSLLVADFGLFAALSGAAVLAAEAAELGLQATASRALVAGTFRLADVVRAKLALTIPVLAAGLALLAVLPVFVPLLVYFTLTGWSELLGVALRARGRRGREAATIVTLRLSGLATAGLALASGGGLRALAWALAASPLPAILLAWAFLQRAPALIAEGPPASARQVLRAALPLGVNGVLALAGVRLELLALGLWRAAGEVGLYASALRVVEFLLLVPAAVAAGAMPALTREGLRGVGPVRGRTAATVALLAVPAAVGLALLAPDVLVLLFGPDYAAGALPLRLLCLGLVPVFMNAVLLHSLIAVGRADLLPRLTGIRVAVASLLAVALIPRFGAAGAALGFAASELVLLGLCARACRAARFPVSVAMPVGLALCASLPMAGAVALAGRGPLASLALGLSTYALTLVAAWRITPRLRHVLVHDVHGS